MLEQKELESFILQYSQTSFKNPHLHNLATTHLELGRVLKDMQVTVFTPEEDRDGWQSGHSYVQVTVRDVPFLIDSLTACLNRVTRGIISFSHPILNIKRTSAGEYVDVSYEQDADYHAESWSTFEISRLLTPENHESVQKAVQQTLQAVLFANEDWQAMVHKATNLASIWSTSDNADAIEVTHLLRWLADNHLTFLGYRYYEFDSKSRVLKSNNDSALGVLKMYPDSARELPKLSGSDDFALSGKPLIISKTRMRSLVHRPVHMDYFGVKDYDAKGNVVGEHRFIGLLSREAYTNSVLEIPVMSTTASLVLKMSGYKEKSHDYRNLLQFLDTFPRDEMLQVSAVWLKNLSEEVLIHRGHREVNVFLHKDRFSKFISVLLFIPRDSYDTDTRIRIEEYLKHTLRVSELESSIQLDQSSLARVHFRVLLDSGDQIVDAEKLESEIRTLAQSWIDQFTDQVFAQLNDDHDRYEFMRIWGEAFDKTYQAEYPVSVGLADALAITERRTSRFYMDESEAAHIVLYSPDQQLKLSKVLPILSAFGLDVADENPFHIETADETWWIHNIGFSSTQAISSFAEEQISQAIEELLNNRFEITDLLRLIVLSECSLDEVIVLSCYVSYLSQWIGHSIAYINQTILENHVVAKPLMTLMHAQFKNPDDCSRLAADVRGKIDSVVSLEHDRILRALLQCVQATLRMNLETNEFQESRLTVLKFRSEQIELMAEPRPMFEIWMDSSEIRGVHLRFGKVARGGLRWSDRLDDVRVEVLGLVRAQFSKNSIIVPTGAKGGFVPKLLQPTMSREEVADCAKRAYQKFISALLSVTDNLVHNQIVKPEGVLIRDEDDPYFVVAADKGTATFSDTANALALERRFWLGDAFASGGSKGYDHKAMGITARGAFESVKHHLSLRGIDINSQKVRTVGIGDMSGDVFGNGMLLSENIQLIAAFDHRHIFIDPMPSQKAYKERQRLFELPRSSWEDFDSSIISKGGGVFPRSEKSITISKEAALALGIDSDVLTFAPYELISHILKAPVDLLYNGGIGTYVKSTTESHLEVGDKANDALRVNGGELRCNVVGEGGNLGFTQSARVEAALAGVSINTDAIDNSAGVDTSDHEVNLKILLASINPETRDSLLRELTDTVAEQVLLDNISQNEVLTLAHEQAHSMLDVHKRMIDFLQKNAGLHPRKEGLPTSEEIERRNSVGLGLTRPELSVLLAYAKIHLRNELLKTKLVDEPWAEQWLFHYFPKRLHQDYANEIRSHRLRREITSTVVANRIINLTGISAVYRLMDETNSSLEQAVAALVVTLAVNDIDAVHKDIVEFNTAWSAKISLLREMRRCIDRSSRWIISNRSADSEISESIEFFAPALKTLRENLQVYLKGFELSRWKSQSAGYQQLGFTTDIADRTAGLLDDYSAFDIQVLASEAKLSFDLVATIYFMVMEAFNGDQILTTITTLPRSDRWQTMARGALRADTYSAIARLTRNVLKVAGETAEMKLSSWQKMHSQSIARVEQLIDDVLNHEKVDIASVSVALRALRDLIRLTS
ncbi:MAG: hypothetical protein RIS09_944 [Actinomycetota bacterium]